MKTINKMSVAAGILIAMLGLSLVAQANIINSVLIDFGGTVTYVNPQPAGTYWNNIGGNETISNLRATNNTSSGIGIVVSGAWGINSWNSGDAISSNLGKFAYDSVIADGLYNLAGGTATVTLTNLSSSFTYNLILYGARENSTRYTYYTVGLTTKTQQTGSAVADWIPTNTTSFLNLTPDSNGKITMTFTGKDAVGADTFSYLNAMEIQVIPEPATIGMLSLGAAGMLIVRRLRNS